MGIKIGPDGKIWYVNATTNEVVRIDGLSVGLNLPTVVASFQLYPNPAGNQISVRLDATLESNCEVLIYNATGQLVLESKMHSGESFLNLNIGDLTAGIYAIKLRSGIDVQSSRFIKE